MERNPQVPGALEGSWKVCWSRRAVDICQEVADDDRAAVDVRIDQIVKGGKGARTEVETHRLEKGAIVLVWDPCLPDHFGKSGDEDRNPLTQRLSKGLNPQGSLIALGPLLEQVRSLLQWKRKGVDHLVRIANRGIDRLDLGPFAGREKAGDDKEAGAVSLQDCAGPCGSVPPGLVVTGDGQGTLARLCVKPLPGLQAPDQRCGSNRLGAHPDHPLALSALLHVRHALLVSLSQNNSSPHPNRSKRRS